VPQGGNTGLCGGATPIGGEVVIALTRLNRIRAVDADNNSITVEAGCTLHAVQEAAREVDRLFPLSLAAEGSATIGGNLSTNAGGVQVLRYGNARELALGLEVVLADGASGTACAACARTTPATTSSSSSSAPKARLGLITAATLKLFPRPRARHGLGCGARSGRRRRPARAPARCRRRQRHGLRDRRRPALELVLKHIPGARDPLLDKPEWQLLIELSGARADLPATLERRSKRRPKPP
jgi:FAD/FMN-containing dehydrogenase